MLWGGDFSPSEKSPSAPGAGGGRCLEPGNPSAHPGHVVIIKSHPEQQSLWGSVAKAAVGMQGAVSILALASPRCLGRTGYMGLVGEGAGAACVAVSWGLGIPEGMVVAAACVLAPWLAGTPSRCPLLCQATLSCPQLSQGSQCHLGDAKQIPQLLGLWCLLGSCISVAPV